MFNNTEEEDRDMVNAVAEAIHVEMGRQIREQRGGVEALAIVAIMAMVRWAHAHPPNVNDNDRRH